jgi:hypothetical protein
MRYETNIFPILNCNELTAGYRLFQIMGLSDSNDEYDSHKQYIIKKLSYDLAHPVTVISKLTDDDEKADFLVIRDDDEIAAQVPVSFDLKRGDSVLFKPTKDALSLDFLAVDNENLEICRRFLQFSLADSFDKIHSLWSPGSGKPYFSKNIDKTFNGIDIYKGFIPRVVDLEEGGWGIDIEVTKKFISHTPLDKYISRKDFNKVPSNHFVYHYGNKWYEVMCDEWSDLNASEYLFTRESDGKKVTILQDLREKFNGINMPPEIASLPDDISLLLYKNNKGLIRRIPAALCYRILDTEEIGTLHDMSILEPFFRRKYIWVVRKKYLDRLYFGQTLLKLAPTPLKRNLEVFQHPDQEFRHNNVISVKGRPGAIMLKTSEIGKSRRDLLNDPNIGCYENRPFEPQYFLMPESIASSFGATVFLEDLKKMVGRMHPIKQGWQPEVIMYDDRNNSDVHQLAFEIMSQVHKNIETGGYAVIMLPNTSTNAEDELAAICTAKCADMEPSIQASIMHTHVLRECIKYNPQSGYEIVNKGKYFGYIKGVALNQILLNNERWPFVLAEPLNADITIGIDVKKNVAGYVFVDKYAKNIKPFRQRSQNKERLSKEQVFNAIVSNVKVLSSYMPIKKIVIHRDGRLFQTELAGINKAIQHLKDLNCIDTESEVSIVEIPKHSTFSLRLFDVNFEYDVLKTSSNNNVVKNPKIGSWFKQNENEGFVCTTGREFRHQGSSKPLYVKKSCGPMGLRELLADIFFLSTLAFTKPDDCSRNPLTIKMTDRLINDYGEQYDLHKYQQAELLKEEEI